MKSVYTLAIPVIIISLIAISCTRPGKIFHPLDLPSGTKWLQVGGIPVVYTDQGEGDPLLILSSFPLSVEFWDPLARFLSPSFRVIVIDPPWLIEPVSMGENFSSEHLLQVYRAFLRKLGLKKVHVMGVGEGGGLAIGFGHHFPEHIRTAISINGFEGVGWSDQTREMLDRIYDTTETGIKDLLKVGSLKYRQEEDLSKRISRWMEPLEKKERIMAVSARKAGLTQDIQSLYILTMIEYINFPILMIRSDSDSILPDNYAEWARRRIRGVEYRILPDAGHFTFLDQPERMAELIRDFVAGHPAERH